jgi:hypothetical protein
MESGKQIDPAAVKTVAGLVKRKLKVNIRMRTVKMAAVRRMN